MLAHADNSASASKQPAHTCLRSKVSLCPYAFQAQVGACIVNTDNVILGIGYNGFPRGCSDHALPWAKASTSGDALETKYPYVVHAEANALLNKNLASVTGAVSLLAKCLGSML